MLEKGSKKRVQGANGEFAADPQCEKQTPLLHQHLTQSVWPDGEVRQTSSLVVFSESGVFKAMLRDKNEGLCLWVASETFTGLWKVMEAALRDPDTEWRVDRQKPQDTAKRVKR